MLLASRAFTRPHPFSTLSLSTSQDLWLIYERTAVKGNAPVNVDDTEAGLFEIHALSFCLPQRFIRDSRE